MELDEGADRIEDTGEKSGGDNDGMLSISAGESSSSSETSSSAQGAQ